MLQNILSDEKIVHQLNSILQDVDKYENFAKLISMYSNGMWVYPGVIKRKLNLTISTTYAILKILENNNILDSYYELYCGNCQHTSGQIFNAINELPQTFECEMCNHELLSIENAMLIYKVVAS